MANVADDRVSVTELRAIDYEFAARFSQLVSKCAAEIVASTDDRGIQNNALLWRTDASPQARTAAFNQDPLAGLIELWALAGQQHAYFVSGDGRDLFGDHRVCAIETATKLEQEAEELARGVISDKNFERVDRAVTDWVAAHPIEGRLYVRSTARADLAGLVHTEGQGGFKAVGSIEETFRDLNDRIAILSVQVPVEARWQAEYLINSLFEERLSKPTDALVSSMNEVSAFLDDFETTLGHQTTRMLDGFTVEREAVFAAIEDERAQILGALEGERIAVLDSVDTEVDRALGRVEETGRGLIDHFFARLIGILVAIGIFIFILVAVLIGALRTGPRTPTRPESDTPQSGEN